MFFDFAIYQKFNICRSNVKNSGKLWLKKISDPNYKNFSDWPPLSTFNDLKND